MKKFNFTLAALALIAAGCSNQDFTEAVQENRENNPRTITLQTSMPEITDDTPATRTTYESDGAEISGIVMKWETTDKLKLCFKHGDACYHKDADIVPGGISADGKTATFMLTVPTEIPAADAFDFYAVFQKKCPSQSYGCKFEEGTANYEFERHEENNVTLDKTGNGGCGIINPMMLFSRPGVTAARLSTLKLDFAHTGWVMALHLKNSSAAEMDLPFYVDVCYGTESATSFIWNGIPGDYTVKMDVTSGTVISNAEAWNAKASVRFNVNGAAWLPLHGQKLGAGATIVIYRWAISTDQVDRMQAGMFRMDGATKDNSSNFLPAKSVTKGKVYHVYVDWNGTDLKLTDRAGTPLP